MFSTPLVGLEKLSGMQRVCSNSLNIFSSVCPEHPTAVRGLQSDDDETVNLTDFAMWSTSVKKMSCVLLKDAPAQLEGHAQFVVAVADATLLICVTPHQLIERLCGQVWPSLSPVLKAVSFTQGMDVTPDGFELILKVVRASSVSNVPACWTNFANELTLQRLQ